MSLGQDIWDTATGKRSLTGGAGSGIPLFDPLNILDVSGNRANEQNKQGMAQANRQLRNRDNLVKSGMETGRSRAEDLYGMDNKEIGTNIQDIIKRRRDQMDQNDPVSNAIRGQTSQEMRQLRSGQARSGVSGAGALAQQLQTQRQANLSVGQSLFANQQKSLGSYQDLLGNIASTSGQLELMHGALRGSGQFSPPQKPQGGIFSGLLG